MKYRVIDSSRMPSRYNIKNGDIGTLVEEDKANNVFKLHNDNWYQGGQWWFHESWVSPICENPNREYLRDFIKLNNINVSAVSRYLGHTRSWLATMYLNRKYDITDETLKIIIKKLHIDWASNEFIHVKKTKQHTAYRIKPTSCLTSKSRLALQETMWRGDFV